MAKKWRVFPPSVARLNRTIPRTVVWSIIPGELPEATIEVIGRIVASIIKHIDIPKSLFFISEPHSNFKLWLFYEYINLLFISLRDKIPSGGYTLLLGKRRFSSLRQR